MTVAVWPTELPRPEKNTYGLQQQDSRLKRQSEAGPPSYRRRFSSAAKMVSLSVFLDADQRAIFDNFFDYELKKGSLLFWIPDPTTDCWPLLGSDGGPMLTNDGTPILLGAQWLCVFGDSMPSETVIGLNFRKTFNVAVIP